MTNEEIRDSIKKDIGVSDEYIDEFCKHNNFSIIDYRIWLDRALAARKKEMPKDYPKAIIIKSNKDT